MNKIELMGRLVADVELKKASKKEGSDYARFTLAVPRKNVKDKTDFINCVAFGKLAEVISKYCKKGQRIIGIQGTEYILRMGSAKIIATQKGGIADATLGVDLPQNTPMPANHLLIVPFNDGRGVLMETDGILLIKGTYTIS